MSHSARSAPGVDLNIWLGRETGDHDDQSFTRLAEALRELQDKVAGGRPPPELAADAVRELEALSARLTSHQVSEADQVAGRQFTRPSRGQTFLPSLQVDLFDGERVGARVTFSRFYLGSNGAAHGGAIALLFDDLLGQLANGVGEPRARTAFLHLDYRAIVPIDRELTVTAWRTRREGRKLFIAGAIHDGAQLLSEANGLFVRLEAHHA
jgi:acyl-coenzyme A thioesterase PaaI-like protein